MTRSVAKAWAAYAKTRPGTAKAWAAYTKAWLISAKGTDYNKTITDRRAEIEPCIGGDALTVPQAQR